MIIGFTGTEKGMTYPQEEKLTSLLKAFRPTVVVHGGCVGADSKFHKICRDQLKPRPRICVLPSNIRSKQGNWLGADFVAREAPPLERNDKIVRDVEVLIATPEQNEEIMRSGTWATIRYAKKRNVPVIILYRQEVRI